MIFLPDAHGNPVNTTHIIHVVHEKADPADENSYRHFAVMINGTKVELTDSDTEDLMYNGHLDRAAELIKKAINGAS